MTILGIAKEYGINHYRYHTACPPDAAFTAADLLGVYMAPELPFWGTVAEEGEEGYDERERDFLFQEASVSCANTGIIRRSCGFRWAMSCGAARTC